MEICQLRGALEQERAGLKCAISTASWVIQFSRPYSDGGGKKCSKGPMENSSGRITRLAPEIMQKVHAIHRGELYIFGKTVLDKLQRTSYFGRGRMFDYEASNDPSRRNFPL